MFDPYIFIIFPTATMGDLFNNQTADLEAVLKAKGLLGNFRPTIHHKEIANAIRHEIEQTTAVMLVDCMKFLSRFVHL